ncbi:MAG: hypothetical protein VB036_17845, partial [Propionicimonas sp.]|nr:hypothetical protein [Propionicimonas sp.]
LFDVHNATLLAVVETFTDVIDPDVAAGRLPGVGALPSLHKWAHRAHRRRGPLSEHAIPAKIEDE